MPAGPTWLPLTGPGRGSGRRPGAMWLWWGYLALATGLALVGVSAPAVRTAMVRDALAVAGVVALGAGVWWRRPAVATGWWLIVAGAAAGAVVSILVGTPAGHLGVPDDWPTIWLSVCALTLLAVGLLALGRLGGRAEVADALDATMVSLATFLVLFSLVIHPVLPLGGATVTAAIVLPLGALLVFAMAVRVVLAVGLPTVSLRLLLAAMAALVATVVSVLVSALTPGGGRVGAVSDVLLMSHSVLIGLSGLHPSLAQADPQFRRTRKALSTQRTALLVILSVIAPLAWGFEIKTASRIGHDPVGFAVPVSVSALLLVLLVTRLAMTARVAEVHASRLAHRSEELSEAIVEQEALQRQLRHQAMHDPLTGLPNRLVLNERMEWVLSRPTGSAGHTLALLDLDNFKDVNDTLGHPVGDELLIEAGRRLLHLAPARGTVVRLGGDEFAALLEDTPQERALEWAEQVRQSIRGPYRLDQEELVLTGSIGLFTTDPAGATVTPSDALRNADLALYEAKAAGKNRVVVYRPELYTARAEFSRLTAGLRRALAEDEFTLHYQPVVDLRTRRIHSVEALLRWTPRDGRPVPPAEFIPVAEHTGMIRPIGTWVIRQACRDAAAWYRRRRVAVTVNISARQLDEPDFATTAMSALRDAGLPGEALVLEITESSLVATSAASDAMDQLQRLRRERVRVAIDDFGTGYSSLAYVARLPVDIVKIDRSFVQNPATTDGGTQPWAFTRAILQLVESLGLEAVAEGVETLEQAEALRELRCRFAQGYLFARPVPAAVIDQLVEGSASVPGPPPDGGTVHS